MPLLAGWRAILPWLLRRTLPRLLLVALPRLLPWRLLLPRLLRATLPWLLRAARARLRILIAQDPLLCLVRRNDAVLVI